MLQGQEGADLKSAVLCVYVCCLFWLIVPTSYYMLLQYELLHVQYIVGIEL